MHNSHVAIVCLRAVAQAAVLATVGLACPRPPAPLPPEPAPEPLPAGNTACFTSFTPSTHRFGDSTLQAGPDSSFLVIYGVTDTLVSERAGPIWLYLKVDGWRTRQHAWSRGPGDTIVVAFFDGPSRHEYRLRLHADAAQGVGREWRASRDSGATPAVSTWGIRLQQIRCRGMRELQDAPPNPEPDLAGRFGAGTRTRLGAGWRVLTAEIGALVPSNEVEILAARSRGKIWC